ncbi:MAG: SpoIIE family protein phosphatase [Clostridiales bacterium]|jgi:stage II sporulation protein E|nr:SpoIIE family protein phosphatase [Clostridiales bacterium]
MTKKLVWFRLALCAIIAFASHIVIFDTLAPFGLIIYGAIYKKGKFAKLVALCVTVGVLSTSLGIAATKYIVALVLYMVIREVIEYAGVTISQKDSLEPLALSTALMISGTIYIFALGFNLYDSLMLPLECVLIGFGSYALRNFREMTLLLWNGKKCNFKEEWAKIFNNIGVVQSGEGLPIVESISNKVCRRCARNDECWQKNYNSTFDALSKLLPVYEEFGEAVYEDFPDYFTKSCIRFTKLKEALNDEYKKRRANRPIVVRNTIPTRTAASGRFGNKVSYNQLADSFDTATNTSSYITKISDSRTVSENIARLGHISAANDNNSNIGVISNFGSLARKADCDVEFNPALDAELSGELIVSGVRHSSVVVVQNSQEQYEVNITLRSNNLASVDSVMAVVNQVLKRPFELASDTLDSLGRHKLRLVECPRLKVEVTGQSMRAQSQDVCGDTFSFRYMDDGKYIIAISDGMGIGECANKYSNATVDLAQRFLKAGIDRLKTMELVNSVLMLKEREDAYATADVLVIDLFNGRAEFIKTGANTSYIVRQRENVVEQIPSTSLPVGILGDADIETRTTYVDDGDYVIMVSDGAENPQTPWIAGYLSSLDLNGMTPQNMMNDILQQAEVYNESVDDVTVVVAKVKDEG